MSRENDHEGPRAGMIGEYEAAYLRRELCLHPHIRWAPDGVDGVCKECGETVPSPFPSSVRSISD